MGAWDSLIKTLQGAVTPTVNKKGQGNAAYNILQPFAQAQNFIENGRTPTILPTSKTQFNLSNPSTYAPTAYNFGAGIVNNVAQTAGNTTLDLVTNTGRTLGGARPLLNYNQTRSPFTKLGYQAGGALNSQSVQQYGINMGMNEALGNAGAGVDYLTNFMGGAKGLQLLKSQAPLKVLIKQGIKEGAALGAASMGGQALYSNRQAPVLDQLSRSVLPTAEGAVGGAVLGGLVPASGALAKYTDNILRATPFKIHVEQAINKINETPKLLSSMREQVASNAEKVGFMSDMKQHFRNLDMPPVYQTLSKEETKQVSRYITGITDSIPKELQKKIEKNLPKQSWKQLGSQIKKSLRDESSGFIDPDLLTGGLASKLEGKVYRTNTLNGIDPERIAFLKKKGYASITDGKDTINLQTGQKSNSSDVISSLNPTGGLLVDYNPKARASSKLADNMTTINATMGGRPDDLITVYRGAPTSQKGLNPGDFITTNKDLAQSYSGSGQVISGKVRKGDILDDIREPLGEEYIYRPGADKEINNSGKTKSVTQKVITRLRDQSGFASPDLLTGGLASKLEKKVNASDPFYNTQRIKIAPEKQQALSKTISEAKPMIEKVVGKPLRHAEVEKLAQTTTDELISQIGRQKTAEMGAAQLRLRQNIAAMADSGTVTKEMLQKIVADKSFSADTARLLGQRAIDAAPTTPTGKLKALYLQNILKVNDDIDAVLKAADGVDWNNPAQTTALYREFIKPSVGDWVDKLRYNSMLSSPTTQIVNVSANLQGSGILQPIQMGVEGAVDALASVFSPGRDRTRLAGEGGAYAKGYVAAGKEAWNNFLGVWKGTNLGNNPDTYQIPLSTSGAGKAIESVLDTPGKALESMDQFFYTLTKGGFDSSNAYRAAKGVSKGIDVEEAATKQLFRNDLTQEGAGVVSNFIGAGGKFIKEATQSDNQSVRWLAKMTLPFINIGTNLAKVGAEYNPVLGSVNMIGNTDKVAQTAKIAIGGAVSMVAAGLAMGDNLTFAEPTSAKEKEAFRAAHMQPYAIKVGDKWIAYNKMHPAIAFQLATVGALTQAVKEGKITEDAASRIANGAVSGLQFIADQTYFKNVGDFVGSVSGDADRVGSLIANYPSQAIPFRAGLSWINRMIDTYQRKPDTEADLATRTAQSIFMQLPGLSGNTPQRLGPDGLPIQNDYPLLNAVSPAKVTQENPGMANYYNELKATNNIKSDTRAINDFIKQGGDASQFFGGSNSPTTSSPQNEMQVARLKAQKSQLESQLNALSTSDNDAQYQLVKDQIDQIDSKLSLSSLSSRVADISKASGTSVLQQSMNKSKQTSLAKDIGRQVLDGTLSANDALPLLQQLGYDNPKQVEYALAADLNDDDQAAYVLEALQSGTKTQELIDNKVLTSGVAKKLYDQGVISAAELNGIKAKTTKPKIKKAKKISITLSAPKTRLTNSTKSARLQIKLPKPKLQALKA